MDKMTKGEFMKMIYTEEELRNIDSAIPVDRWEEYDPSYHVMNYNDNSVFGTIENLYDVAAERKIIEKYYDRRR